ncbi:hypothetical protein FQN60_018248, partial [Etheostoma spectabile]
QSVLFNHLLRSGKFLDLSIPSQGQVNRERFQLKLQEELFGMQGNVREYTGCSGKRWCGCCKEQNDGT